MKCMNYSHCVLLAAVVALSVPSLSSAQSSQQLTCQRGNVAMQDTPLTPTISESSCNGDTGCLVGVRQQNAEITIQNNAIIAHNTTMASLRAQCDQQFAQQDQQAAQQAAQKQQEQMQKAMDAMKNLGQGGGGDKKGGGDKGGDNGEQNAKNQGLDSGKDDGQGKTNDSAKSQIEQGEQQIKGLPGVQGAEKLSSAVQKYKQARESCAGNQSTAAGACNSENSPSIQSAQGTVDGANGTTSGGVSDTGKAGVQDNFGPAADGLKSFIGDCQPKNDSCKSSCGEANKALDEVKQAAQSVQCGGDEKQKQQCQAKLPGAQKQVTGGVDQEKNAGDKSSVAGKEKTCSDKNQKTLASAMDGLGKMLQALAGAMGQQANSAATAAPTVTANMDCSDATQAATPACICAANPRAAGCDTAGGAGMSQSASMAGVGSNSSTTSCVAPATLSSGGGGINLDPIQPSASSASTPGGGGGGAPIGGSSGFGGNAAAAGGADGRKGLDTNILGGAGGGGGGGSGGWGGGSGGTADAKYRDYLPGGKRDPASAAAAAAWRSEVSGQGGKTNWEKVSDRYRDAKSSLLNNN